MLDLPSATGKRVSIFLLAALFGAAGIGHFAAPDFFMEIMPPYLPWHWELVAVSGVFEILGAAGLLYGPTRRAAGIGLIALLVAVFPANVHMALNPEPFLDRMPLAALYVRLPLQFAAMAWVYWAALRE